MDAGPYAAADDCACASASFADASARSSACTFDVPLVMVCWSVATACESVAHGPALPPADAPPLSAAFAPRQSTACFRLSAASTARACSSVRVSSLRVVCAEAEDCCACWTSAGAVPAGTEIVVGAA